VFALQLSFFAVYRALVTYTLFTRWQAGVVPALLFALAMGLHRFAADHVLAEHFPVRLTVPWRLVLAGGALAGWLVAIVAHPTNTPSINVLTAFSAAPSCSTSSSMNCPRSVTPASAGSSRVWCSTPFC
jgi:hypothetical protein